MNSEGELCPGEEPEQEGTAAKSQETELDSPLTVSSNQGSPQETHHLCFSSANARIWKRETVKDIVISILVIVVIALIAVLIGITRTEQHSHAVVSAAQCSPECPRQWIGYEGKCYFLSKEKRNWTSSQEFCSSQNASLASVEREEKDFVMRIKDGGTYWIGFRKKSDPSSVQPKGKDSVIKDEDDCFYLDNEFSPSGCHAELPGICSKAARCPTL